MRFLLAVMGIFLLGFLSVGASIQTTTYAATASPTPIIPTPNPTLKNANWKMTKSSLNPGFFLFQEDADYAKYSQEVSKLSKGIFLVGDYERFDARVWAKGADTRNDALFSLRKYNADGTITLTVPKQVRRTLIGCLSVAYCVNQYYTDTTLGAWVQVYDRNKKLIKETENPSWRGGFITEVIWDGSAWKLWSLQDSNLPVVPTPTPNGKPVIPTPVPVFDGADWTLVQSDVNPSLFVFQDSDVYRKYSNDTLALLVGVFDPSYERFDAQFWSKDADPKAADYYFFMRKYNTNGTITIIHPKKLQRMLIGCVNAAYCASRFYTDTTPGAIIHTYDKTGKLLKQVEDANWRGGFFGDFVWDGKAWKLWALYDIVDKPINTPAAK